MKRIRDAETGQYISKKEAEERDRSTWVEEADFDKGAFLEKVFEFLVYKSFRTPANGRVVKLTDVEKLFSKYGREVNMDNVFINKLRRNIEGLSYLSETDAPVIPFLSGKVADISRDVILQQTNRSPYEKVEELDFNEFFDNLSSRQSWFGEEEIKSANKYSELKKLLKQHLNNIKVFKIGEIQKDIYIVGCDPEGNLRGVQMRAVET